MLQEKDTAPDFELFDDAGQPTRLSDFRGKRVLLYFYPKSMTSGCTIQAQSLRDDFTEYQAAGVIIIGVSPDPVKQQAKFKEKESLPFILLADENHKLAEKYGVWVEKSMYGKKYWGNERTSFLIDAEGNVEKIFRKVTPKTHSEQILAAVNCEI
jgi:peroxiredoxin Q/BCP